MSEKKKKRCKNFIITRFHVKKGMFFWNPSGADLFFVKKFLNSYPRDCKTIHVDRNCVMMHWQWKNKPLNSLAEVSIQKVKIEKVFTCSDFNFWTGVHLYIILLSIILKGKCMIWCGCKAKSGAWNFWWLELKLKVNLLKVEML